MRVRSQGPAHRRDPAPCLQTGALPVLIHLRFIFFAETVKIRERTKEKSVSHTGRSVCGHQGAALSCSSTFQLNFTTHTNKDVRLLGLPDWPIGVACMIVH